MSAITSEKIGEILVVGFTDTKILDSQRIEQIGDELQKVIAQATDKKLLCTFRGVSFMSSPMVTKLLQLHKACKSAGVTLKFSDISPNMMEVFRITNLNKMFDIQTDEAAAVKSFNKKGWFG